MRQLLNTTVTVLRSAYTNTANMGISEAESEPFSFPASVQPASTSVQQFYAQRQVHVSHTVFTAGTLDLRRGDRLTDGTLTLQVIGWRDLSGRGKVTAVDCDEYLP